MFDGLDATGQPKTVPAKQPPTMRQLMTHTAGLRYGFDPTDPLDKLYQAAQVWQSESLAEIRRQGRGLPLAYQPGTKWLYSMSMDVQGGDDRALDRPEPARISTGTRIFEPLGMVDTAFHTPPEKRARRATLYRWSPKQRALVESPPILGRDYEAPPALANGGGGLVSTAADYARFAQMLLNGGELDGMRDRQRRGAEAADVEPPVGRDHGRRLRRRRCSRSARASATASTARCSPIRTRPACRSGKGTYQWDGAAGTWFWVDPVHDLLFVGLIQRLAEQTPPIQKITQTMMADAYLD